MASGLFDNLMKVIKVSQTHGAATLTSTEIDLELPRGYIAKVKKVIFRLEGWEAVTAALANQRIDMALVRDPDDAATIEIPDNEVQHDVVCDYHFIITMDATDDLAYKSLEHVQFDFDQHEEMDVISARNMRFNAQAENATGVDLVAVCEVYYTLERVTDTQFLELLDIL